MIFVSALKKHGYMLHVYSMVYLFHEHMLRKKRLTPEWRDFIRPLMWRCKLVELQIRELCSHISKYEGELEECHRRKQTEWGKYAAEDHSIKSVPFSYQNQPVKLMKRRRRKRVEETVDLASYTSSHHLLSYFGMICFNTRDYFLAAMLCDRYPS